MARLCAGLKACSTHIFGGRAVSVKKAKGKGKGTAKKPAKEKAETSAGKNIVEVRGNIDNLVKASAELIAAEVIKVALTGQLATAKYLFEAIGLYPATEHTAPAPVIGSLAHTLLKRMGLPTEPVIGEENETVAVLTSAVKDAATETTGDTKEDLESACEEEQVPAEEAQ
jgi:hypothetical protein